MLGITRIGSLAQLALLLALTSSAHAADAPPAQASVPKADGDHQAIAPLPAPASHSASASGTIDGAGWAFCEGLIRPTSTRGVLEIDLYPAHPASAADAAGMPRALIAVPRKAGSFVIGSAAMCTLVAPPMRNLVATKGTICIDEIDGNHVAGTIDCTDGSHSTVRGHFTARVADGSAPAHAAGSK